MSRLLWEIGDHGTDLLALRDRLGLDSGYASRLVRRLESEGLISVDTDPTDQRRRQLRWTVAGRAEVRELDRRSDLAASAVLDGLPAARQQRLLAAVAEVERSLRATLDNTTVLSRVGRISRDARPTCRRRQAPGPDRRRDGGSPDR
jgi:DNA-binding MarR family transcriptional regulator